MFASQLSSISHRTTVVPRENWKQFFWGGVGGVHCGLCENGTCLLITPTPPPPCIVVYVKMVHACWSPQPTPPPCYPPTWACMQIQWSSKDERWLHSCFLERARWHESCVLMGYPAHKPILPLCSRKIIFCPYNKSNKVAGYVFSLLSGVFMNLDFFSVHKNAERSVANIQPSRPLFGQ